MFYRISLKYKKYDYSINVDTEHLHKYSIRDVNEIISITEEEYICGLFDELRSTLIRDVIGLDTTVKKIIDVCGGVI